MESFLLLYEDIRDMLLSIPSMWCPIWALIMVMMNGCVVHSLKVFGLYLEINNLLLSVLLAGIDKWLYFEGETNGNTFWSKSFRCKTSHTNMSLSIYCAPNIRLLGKGLDGW